MVATQAATAAPDAIQSMIVSQESYRLSCLILQLKDLKKNLWSIVDDHNFSY